MLNKILQFIAKKLNCLPVENGGTGVTTKDDLKKMLNLPIEQGDEPPWHWEKYTDGKQVLSRTFEITSIPESSWKSWGNEYYFTINVVQPVFPVDFISKPYLKSIALDTNNYLPMERHDETKIIDVELVRPTKNTTPAGVLGRIEWEGRWK